MTKKSGAALVLALAALVVGGLTLRARRGAAPEAKAPGAAAGAATPTYLPVDRPTALDQTPRLPLNVSAPARPAGAPKRVVMLGWDGASWDLLIPLMQAGKLPHLRALIAGGAYGNLDTIEPTFSTVVWTSIATGVPPSRHGILDFVERPHDQAITRMSPAERTKLHFYSNADRRSKAIWNLASDAGLPVLVVGYHNTYPAEPVKGMMVANYLVRENAIEGYGVSPASSLRAGGFVQPPGESRDVVRMVRPLSSLTHAEMSRFVDVDARKFDELVSRPNQKDVARERWDRVRRAYLYDEFHAQVALRYLDTVKPALTMLHFQSADWASHLVLRFHQAGAPPEADAEGGSARRARSMYAPTVTAFYEYLDEWLGRLRERQPADTVFVVLSDHGFEATLDDRHEGVHDHAPPGVIVLSGPGIGVGKRLEGATIYDVLPTVASLLGLPVAQDLPGKVLEEALDTRWRQSAPTRYVARYDAHAKPPAAQADASLEQTLEEELQSVGYLR